MSHRSYGHISFVLLAAVVACAWQLCLPQSTEPPRSTNPAEFTEVMELPLHGKAQQIVGPTAEVDSQSTIRIRFEPKRMMLPRPLREGATEKSPAVNIRMEAYVIKGSSRSPVAPLLPYVENFVAPGQASSTPGGSNPQTGTTNSQGGGSNPPPSNPTGAAGSQNVGTIVFHDKIFNPEQFASVPDTEIRLLGSSAGSADYIELRITNLRTQEALNLTLVPQVFGFHFRPSDTLMFVKRLGIGAKERQAGIGEFNFGAAPGVSYGGTYLARKNAFLRFFQPGAAITVLFTKWDNPAFDVSTGQFVPGTKSGDIQTGLGGQLTLFANVVQIGYGANLQVDQKRTYFGVGVSFVNLTTKLAGLLSK